MREKDITEAIQNYWQRKDRAREDLITAHQKVKEAHDSDPASYSNAVNALLLFDDLLEEAESILKQCVAETKRVEHLVEGLIKYAENNLAINDYDSIIAAKGINSALAEKGANEYLPAGLLKRFEERREKIRKHPVPSLRASTFGATPTEQENPSRHSQRAESSPYPEQQKKSCKSEIPKLKGRNLLLKNNAEQEKWAELFIVFLKQHKRSNEELSTTAENYINRALFRFIFEWEKNNMLRKERNAQAPSVFLFASCKLKGVAFRGHANVIERLSVQCFKEDDKNDDLHLHVAEFIRQHKTTTINTTKD